MYFDENTPLTQTLPVAIECLAAAESYVAGISQGEWHASQALRDAVARNLALVTEILEDTSLAYWSWEPRHWLPNRPFMIAAEIVWRIDSEIDWSAVWRALPEFPTWREQIGVVLAAAEDIGAGRPVSIEGPQPPPVLPEEWPALIRADPILFSNEPAPLPTLWRIATDCIDVVERITGRLSEREFLASRMARDAVVRNLGLAGEALSDVTTCYSDWKPDQPLPHPPLDADTFYAIAYRSDDEIDWLAIWRALPEMRALSAKLRSELEMSAC